MAAKSILMLVGDYAEDYETMVPFQTLLLPGVRTRGHRRRRPLRGHSGRCSRD